LRKTNQHDKAVVGIDSWANSDVCGEPGPTIYAEVGSPEIMTFIDEIV